MDRGVGGIDLLGLLAHVLARLRVAGELVQQVRVQRPEVALDRRTVPRARLRPPIDLDVVREAAGVQRPATVLGAQVNDEAKREHAPADDAAPQELENDGLGGFHVGDVPREFGAGPPPA